MLSSGSRPSVESLASHIIGRIVLDGLSDSFSIFAWSSRGVGGLSVHHDCADVVLDQACARYSSIPSRVVNRWVVRSGMGALFAGFAPSPSFSVERVHSALAEHMHSAPTGSLDPVPPGLDRKCQPRRSSISFRMRPASTYWLVCPAIALTEARRRSASSKRLE